jgi:L-aspartate oxidase
MRSELGVKTSGECEEPKIITGRSSATQIVNTVQNVMWRHAGVIRNATGLREAREVLGTIKERLPAPISRQNCEAINLRQCATLIVRSALAREESRGAHYRTDFPNHEEKFHKHSIAEGDLVRFE